LASLGDPVDFSNEAGSTLTLGMTDGILRALHLPASQLWAPFTRNGCAKALLLVAPHNLAHVALVAPACWPELGAARISGALRLDALPIIASSVPHQLARKVLVAPAFRMTFRILWTRNRLTSTPGIRVPVILCTAPEANFALAWLNTANDTGGGEELHAIIPLAAWSFATFLCAPEEVAGQRTEGERACSNVSPGHSAADEVSVAPHVLPEDWLSLFLCLTLHSTARFKLAAAMVMKSRSACAILHIINNFVFSSSAYDTDAACVDAGQ